MLWLLREWRCSKSSSAAVLTPVKIILHPLQLYYSHFTFVHPLFQEIFAHFWTFLFSVCDLTTVFSLYNQMIRTLNCSASSFTEFYQNLRLLLCLSRLTVCLPLHLAVMLHIYPSWCFSPRCIKTIRYLPKLNLHNKTLRHGATFCHVYSIEAAEMYIMLQCHAGHQEFTHSFWGNGLIWWHWIIFYGDSKCCLGLPPMSSSSFASRTLSSQR